VFTDECSQQAELFVACTAFAPDQPDSARIARGHRQCGDAAALEGASAQGHFRDKGDAKVCAYHFDQGCEAAGRETVYGVLLHDAARRKRMIAQTVTFFEQQYAVCVEVFDTKMLRFDQCAAFAIGEMKTVIEENFSKEQKEVHLVRLSLEDAKGKVISVNEYWETVEGGNFQNMNDLNQINLSVVEASSDEEFIYYELKNETDTPALNIKLNALDAATNEVVLPAYFSEGYFTLMPGESRKVKLSKKNIKKSIKVRVTGYNVLSGNING